MKSSPAIDFLMNMRKLSLDTISQFKLGYCDPKGILDIPGYSDIKPLSFVTPNSVIFPILDLYNNLVGVSARPLSVATNSPKYINTVYKMGGIAEHFYGLNVTWKNILMEKKVYVVEGNISLLTPWQCGIKNVVAMLGLNFTWARLCLLTRFAKKVVFVPDGDKAGSEFINKMKRLLPTKFKMSDMEFSYVQLPDKLDPDDYFKRNSKESFFQLPEIKIYN